jgi:hypothetical protein
MGFLETLDTISGSPHFRNDDARLLLLVQLPKAVLAPVFQLLRALDA